MIVWRVSPIPIWTKFYAFHAWSKFEIPIRTCTYTNSEVGCFVNKFQLVCWTVLNAKEVNCGVDTEVWSWARIDTLVGVIKGKQSPGTDWSTQVSGRSDIVHGSFGALSHTAERQRISHSSTTAVKSSNTASRIPICKRIGSAIFDAFLILRIWVIVWHHWTFVNASPCCVVLVHCGSCWTTA